MNSYALSLLIYAVPANAVAGTIMFLGRKSSLRWHPVEYVLIYLPYLIALALLLFVFGSLEEAMGQSGYNTSLLIFLSVMAGFLGGVSLLPRLFVAEDKLHKLVLTGISSFLLATIYVKFMLLVSIVLS